jgi:hypothetical protein
MFRTRLVLSLLAVAAFSSAVQVALPLQAAELQLSLGIRQTFLYGDTNGDLVVDYTDIEVWEEWEGDSGPNLAADVDSNGIVDDVDLSYIEDNQGASTSGVIGSDGGTSGPLATLGSETLIADGAWQQITFTLPLNLFSRPSDWGVLESLRFGNTADGETLYKVWIDDLASTNSSGATVFGDFESFSPGDEVIFQQPGVASGGDILVTPDLAEVTGSMAHSGSQSLIAEFEFTSDTPGLAATLTTAGVDNLPNPLVQLRDGDYSQVLVDGTVSFTETTVTFWAKAVVVPEPGTFVLLGIGLMGIPSLKRRVRSSK